MKIDEHSISSLIEAGLTDEAFELLLEHLKTVKHPRLNDVIVMKAAYKENNRKHQTGQISDSIWEEKNNKINYNILAILKEHTGNPLVIKPNRFRRNMVIRMSVLLLLLLVGGIVYYKYYRESTIPVTDNHESLADEFVRLANDDLGLRIYPAYQSVYRSGNQHKRTQTIINTKQFIQKALDFDLNTFPLNYKIYHRISLMVAYKIMALLHDDKHTKAEYLNQGLLMADEAEKLIRSIEDIPQNEDKQYMRDWLSDNDHESRIAINVFILKLIDLEIGGRTTRNDVMRAYGKLPNPEAFLKENDYNDYPIIKKFITEIKTK